MSQMDADRFVLISTVASFRQVKRLTNNVELVVDVLRGEACCWPIAESILHHLQHCP